MLRRSLFAVAALGLALAHAALVGPGAPLRFHHQFRLPTDRPLRRSVAAIIAAEDNEPPDDAPAAASAAEMDRPAEASPVAPALSVFDGLPLSSAATETLLDKLQLQAKRTQSPPTRGVFCARSLDLRDIKVVGYDMDYTLVDYKMVLWEERAYHYSKEHLRGKGFPVSGLKFNPELVCRGLIIDRELGNLLKVDRFGYVRCAMHGTTMLTADETMHAYGRLAVDLRDSRWTFLNTLFSVSEGCLYAQLVDRLDSGQLVRDCSPPFDTSRCASYEQLYSAVSKALFRAHVQGTLKQEVMEEPSRFVNCDGAMCQTLLDQRNAGKKLALITNSDWVYSNTLMSFVYDRHMPPGQTWRDLFNVIVVSACKPEFFGLERRPVYQMASKDGLLREHFRFEEGKIFAGGNARLVEKCFNVSGNQMLYVGDHIFTDVSCRGVVVVGGWVGWGGVGWGGGRGRAGRQWLGVARTPMAGCGQGRAEQRRLARRLARALVPRPGCALTPGCGRGRSTWRRRLSSGARA